MQLWSSDKTDMVWSWGGVGGRVGGGQGLECLVRETWIWRSLGQPCLLQFSSVAQSYPTLCNPKNTACQASLSITNSPGACSNSCPSSRWCHPTISSSVIPFSPAFNVSQHQGVFQWVSSSHQVAKISDLQLQRILPMNIKDWFPLGRTGLISLQSKGLSTSVLQYHSSKASNFSALSFLYYPTHTSIQDHWKNHSFD